VQTGNLLNRITGLVSIKALAWSHDDTKVVAGGWDGTIIVLDGLTGKLLKSWKGHSSWVKSVVWSHELSPVQVIEQSRYGMLTPENCNQH
jgi:WD40 repeat protein